MYHSAGPSAFSNMPIRCNQGEILLLLRYLNMQPARQGSKTYLGVSRDGVLRRCYFCYHEDSTPVATGTANALASQLGFGNAEAMRDYMDERR
ncbi:MAG: hypothetical protein DDT36_00832 [Firmicutes bacterium]|nr:hypothetical protein [Bacillota bacterium]